MTRRPMRKASEIKNLPASVQSRLLNQAKASKRPFAELLQYYAIERFLYRLSRSPYQSQFVLKGALMFVVWGAPVARPTRDIDLLGHVDNAVDKLVEIAREICIQPVELDGVEFDAASVAGELSRSASIMRGSAPLSGIPRHSQSHYADRCGIRRRSHAGVGDGRLPKHAGNASAGVARLNA